MANIVLEEVSKAYRGGVQAVDRLSLEVADAELVVLVGPSGCGKTTTLRLIAGLERPDRGEIRIAGRSVLKTAPKNRDIALVFQSHALYPHLSVFGNLALPLELRSGGLLRRAALRLLRPAEARRLAEERQTIQQRVHLAAQMLDIEPLLVRRPGELSGGEQQRVALGRAVVRRPAAFLFDEPLSQLDAPLRIELRRELARLQQSLQATILYVTHDQVEAMTLAQRLVVMDQGRVQQAGPPLEVYDRPRNRFVAGFFGSPPMNFVEGVLAAEGSGARFRGSLQAWLAGPLPDAVASRLGGPAVLGVRPEELRVELAEREETFEEARQSGAARLTVAAVESLGDCTLLHLELSCTPITESRRPTAGQALSTRLITKIFGRASWRAGDVVRVTFDPARAHLFDRATGESLTYSR